MLLLVARALLSLLVSEQYVDSVLLEAVQRGYENHRDAFSAVECEYEIRHGGASSLDDAISNGPTKGVRRFSGRWVRDGEHECLTIRPIDGLPSGSTSSPVPLVRVLRDSRYELAYSELFNGGNVVRREVSESLISFTPLDMGAMGEGSKGSPSALIATASPGQIMHLEQQPSDSVRFVRRLIQGEDIQDTQFSISLAKGFALESIVTTINNDVISTVIVTKLQPCTRGRWFPMRSVAVIPRSDGSVIAREIRVLKLDVDLKPPAAAFSVAIPQGAHFNDPRSAGSQIVLTDEFQAELDDLEMLYTETLKAIEIKRKEQDQLVRNRTVLLFATPLTALLVLGLGAWSFWRYYRRGKR